jgi:hypothetical protein
MTTAKEFNANRNNINRNMSLRVNMNKTIEVEEGKQISD